jgi:formate--tetrahydrofolate ligase
LYEVTDSIEQKLTTIATKVYGADGIKLSAKAKKQVQAIEDAGWANVPVCIAKTQYSLSDDRTKIGRPDNFMISIREFKPSVGAGFIVAYAGDMLTMPGLPKRPAAMGMDLDESGKVTGLF